MDERLVHRGRHHRVSGERFRDDGDPGDGLEETGWPDDGDRTAARPSGAAGTSAHLVGVTAAAADHTTRAPSDTSVSWVAPSSSPGRAIATVVMRAAPAPQAATSWGREWRSAAGTSRSAAEASNAHP